MKELEEKAQQLGLVRIAFNVFEHNTVAMNMYKQLGYESRSRTMAKVL